MLKPLLKKIGQALTPPHHWWWGAAIGILIALVILCILGSLNLFDSSTSLGSAFTYFLIKMVRFTLIGFGVVLVIVALEKVPTIYKCMFFVFAYAVYYFFIPIQTKRGITLLALWILASVSFSGGGLFSLLLNKHSRSNSKKAWASLFIGLIGLLMLTWWLWFSVSPFFPPHLTTNRMPKAAIQLSNPSQKGSFTFKEIFYGTGKDLHRPEYGPQVNIETYPVDGSAFIEGLEGVTGWLRSLYWGFDSFELPLNGHVWLPEGKGPFPLVMIVHGNHEMMTPSDSGYEYLGSLLASRGFITVSIDENFLNGSWLNFTGGISEVPARGWLILEHLKLWRGWDEDQKSPFFNKVDMQNIGLVGHSRGGEAIALATAFNQLAYFPGDGNIAFDYNFNIKALAAISPVDAQYKPGGVKTELENVDYFVIHGSHDGDVRSFEGTAQYHRIRFDDSAYHFKAALYVYGANHGQFNSLWGKKDESSPATTLFDIGQIMPIEEQQRIAEVYLSAFFEIALKDQRGYLPIFRNSHNAEQWLPQTLYLNEFADSTFLYIDDDNDGIDIAKTSLAGVQRFGENLNLWKQTLINLKKGHPLRPVTFLGWKKLTDETPSYSIVLPEKKMGINASSLLVISLANADDHETSSDNKNAILDEKSVDFTIELTDDKGQSASLPLSHYAFLSPPIFVKLMKASFLDPLPHPERVFQTFEYPLRDFANQNPQFDPSQIRRIRFIFDRTPKSKIMLDTVAFANSVD